MCMLLMCVCLSIVLCGCGREWTGPTDKELQKEVTGYLIRTESAHDKHEQEQKDMQVKRKAALLLGDAAEIVDDAVAAGVHGRSKPALPKAALGGS